LRLPPWKIETRYRSRMMKRGITRAAFMVVCCVCAGSVVFAAGGTQGGNAASTGPMEILWAGNSDGNLDPNGIMVRDIEERFNVKLNFTPAWNANQQQFNLKVASGLIPDYFYDYNHWTWYRQGILKIITEEQIKTNMPTYYRTRLQYYDPEGIALRSRQDPDGKGYIGVPGVGFPGRLTRGWRQDWLDKLGLKVPETLEEMEKVLLAFANNDPDGNGQNDTIPLLARSSSIHQDVGDIFTAFEVRPRYWLLENGRVIYADVMDGYREALKVLQRWYKAGLIFKEFLTVTGDQYNAYFVEGKVGTTYAGFPYWNTDGNATSLTKSLIDHVPGAKVSIAAPVKGPTGQGYAFDGQNDSNWTMHFGYQVSDEKLAKIMQINDYYQSGEGLIMQQFGKEGITFEYNATGAPQLTVPVVDIYKQGIGNLVINAMDDAAYQMIFKGTGYLDLALTTSKFPMMKNVIGRMPLTESQQAGIGTDINPISVKYTNDAISGAIDIDATWASYVADMNRAGLAQQTAEAQSIYDKYFRYQKVYFKISRFEIDSRYRELPGSLSFRVAPVTIHSTRRNNLCG
jgi:putative aldouronate transport system substrate-binding protein